MLGTLPSCICAIRWSWLQLSHSFCSTKALGRRFTPVDPRCAMELDEILPSEWAKLEAATDEYIAAVSDQLDDCVAVLTAGLPDADGAAGTVGPAAAAALRLGASAHSVTVAIVEKIQT